VHCFDLCVLAFLAAWFLLLKIYKASLKMESILQTRLLTEMVSLLKIIKVPKAIRLQQIKALKALGLLRVFTKRLACHDLLDFDLGAQFARGNTSLTPCADNGSAQGASGALDLDAALSRLENIIFSRLCDELSSVHDALGLSLAVK
jgi:hypothetical protein